MTMQNTNLGGNTKITISGASTGPYIPASWSPASEWKENGYPTEDWTTDKFTYHQIGFINDPKNNQLLLYVNICPDSKANRNSRGYEGGYRQLQPAGYNINIGNATYSVNLDVNPWNIQNGKSGYALIGVWDPQTNQYTTKDNLCHYYADSDGRQSAIIKIPYNMFNRDDLNGSTKMTMQNTNLGGNTKITISGASTSDGRQSAIIKIPYNMFNRDDLNGSTKMTMQNTNLGGNTKITISGASTGPYIPAIIAFVLASIAAISYYHKIKLVRHEHQ